MELYIWALEIDDHILWLKERLEKANRNIEMYGSQGKLRARAESLEKQIKLNYIMKGLLIDKTPNNLLQ